MQTPTQPPEARLIEDLRLAVRPKLSVRRAATMAGISEGRWRQIVKGYNQISKETVVPSIAPADTLARMAWTVGATPEQLREVGRADAADELTTGRLRATGTMCRALSDSLGRLVAVETPGVWFPRLLVTATLMALAGYV